MTRPPSKPSARPGGTSSSGNSTITRASRCSTWSTPPGAAGSTATPAPVAYLGGRKFRPRPIDTAVAEMAAIDNNRLFIVDNSLAQDTQWEKDLFREMIPLKKKWCSHPIEDDPKVLDLAAQAGAWYVYQAVFDTSELIRERIRRYHDHGIAVEGTILLGLDHHTEDYIRRFIDFLLEIELDLAEFTILAPFPHTRAYDELQAPGPHPLLRLGRLHCRQGGLPAQTHAAGKTAGALRLRLGGFLQGGIPDDQDVPALSAGHPERSRRRHLPAPEAGDGHPGVWEESRSQMIPLGRRGIDKFYLWGNCILGKNAAAQVPGPMWTPDVRERGRTTISASGPLAFHFSLNQGFHPFPVV